MTPTVDLACNPGMGPDWESNQGPFGSQASAQSTEPHQPGLILTSFLRPEIDVSMSSKVCKTYDISSHFEISESTLNPSTYGFYKSSEASRFEMQKLQICT